ncbi:SDR family oxidoreductase [Ketobacter sp. MCCC 1A13808]|uniref:SDR family oxidoreductase n=1 Tax=Ketobacter sp. MCCC 1A13808 TaxID=2602738 RepID=UPI000F15BFA7|nr:SDR family oxidoreductase [Ketobacter sp. MCCC 1A13808]MVF13414.1 SDR family oxidoreductase [Ketobacter sp. MCCC 1A13808]RLP55803.1 MAG: SDR family oxidoreductase [Ketobacter sp.]
MTRKLNKTVLITGCSSGIGRDSALFFQNKGWNVVATMRAPGGEQVLNRLPNVICPLLDVTDVESIQKAIQTALVEFGTVDAVVNNAGYALIGAFETLDAVQIRKQFDTNVFGLMEVCRSILPHFRERNQGILINVASMVGRVPLPLYSVYNASKFAVEGFSESLVYELENFDICVKLIEPGATDTAFFGGSSDRYNGTGVKAYDDYCAQLLPLMDSIGPAGSDSQDIAEVIWKAATDGRHQLRYAAGSDARAFLLARRILPDGLFKRTIKISLTPWALKTVGKLFYRT